MEHDTKTLQLFNVYQQYGGEENVVRDLSRRMAGPAWRDLYFHSSDWQQESLLRKISQPLRTFHNPAALKQAKRAQADFQADVWLLHGILPVGSLSLYLLARQLGIPMIQYLHNYRPFSLGGAAWAGGKILPQGLQRRFGPEIRRGAYRGSVLQSSFMALLYKAYFHLGLLQDVAAWISQSQFQKQKYLEAGVDAHRIHVLLPPRDPMPPPTHHRDQGYLLYLGRLVPEKGILFLLHEWAHHPEWPQLVIAGTGPLQAEVESRAASLPNTRCVGEVRGDAKEDLLAGCIATVVPSVWWEVLGLVVFESHAHDKPVIASKTGGLGEIVQHGLTGFQFQPGDSQSFQAAVTQLLATSPAERRAMGARGRRWANEQTDPGRWQQRYHEIASAAIQAHART